MNNNWLEKITKLSYLSLATIPLLKPNFNSMIVILCVLLTTIYFFKSKEKKHPTIKYLLLTLPFFLFLVYETISMNFSEKTILINLPFLIFPLLFFYKPVFVSKKILEKSIFILQLSTITQSFIYFIVFLKKNPMSSILNVSNENIPFFREYVTTNYLTGMHPTYFSAYLLITITISLFFFSRNKLFHAFSIIVSIFFLMLFSSRIIIILTLLTFTLFIILKFFTTYKKSKFIFGISGIILLFLVFASPVVKERFSELYTELNKPIKGDYYNSSNTRLAIYKCDYQLLKEVPFFGFGSSLQEKLNECYGENNDSNFYQKNVYNTHNYYLNVLLYGGWIFFSFFLFYLFTVLKKLKKSIITIFIFSQFLVINLTENFLVRHYGVVLFCYLTTLLIFYVKNEGYTEIR